jgi:signal transduction histidine kinase
VSDRTRRRLAFAIWIATIAFLIATVPVAVAGREVTPVGVVGSIALVIAVLWSTIGARIASVAHGNAVGWLFLNVGLGIAVTMFCQSYIVYGLRVNPGVPGVAAAALIGEYGLMPSVAPLALLFALFPDGRLPSRRWRWVVWAILGGITLALAAFLVKPETLNNYRELGIEYPNPTGLEAFSSIAPLAIFVGTVIAIVGSMGAVMALRSRYRRSSGEVRHQIRWLAFVGLMALTFFIAFWVVGFISEAAGNEEWPVADVLLAGAALSVGFGVPIAAGVAILRYRLYDIDLVINKTLVYGSLAFFITAVYVGVVVGIGSIVGRGDEPNLGLSILATAVVAVAFQPVRSRVQHLANRLVYGKRATPYEVLTEFSHRMASTYASEDVLPRMARILAQGTGAKQARVWLRSGGELHPAASWPEGSSNGSGPNEADLLVPVTHQGEDLGALSIAKAPGDRLSPAEEGLTRDLASQAGLVLRNVRLIEDLKASRVRLVQAQDAERRRIERNIHDGAQQQLVALQVKLGLTRALAPTDPDKAGQLLGELQAETEQALQDLRDLARGIYPPLLQDQGLPAALAAQARKSPLPVTVEAGGIGRYPSEVEAAVYFCVLEALQNVAKYAGATTATVTLSGTDHLTFTVADDGSGFDPATTPRGSGLTNMADRLAALGGEVEVQSTPGHGTTVRGRVGRGPEGHVP